MANPKAIDPAIDVAVAPTPTVMAAFGTGTTSRARAEKADALAKAEAVQAELVAVHAALREAKVKAAAPETLASIARRAVEYAEQMGGAPKDKLAHAVAAAQRLDNDDNGTRDFTDAQLRIAIEAAVKLMKSNREKHT